MELPELSGKTRPYAVLGHPIGHTLSPVMHQAAFRALGMDALYSAFDVRPDDLLEVLSAMARMGFQGVNLTIPHKEVAFRGLVHLDESAELLGAVNTVQFLDDRLVGHTTDGYGFLQAHEEAFGGGVEGETVFVLGTGGAGRTAALVAARAGAAGLLLCDSDTTRVHTLCAELAERFPGVPVSGLEPGEAPEHVAEAGLIIQATPVGMKPDDPVLLPTEVFGPGQRLFDMIYMYPETGIMKAARQAGADVANGLGMLLHQGAKSFEIWTGTTPPIDAMRRALESKVYDS